MEVSIKGKDAAKRGTIEQKAHLMRDTRKGTYITVAAKTPRKARKAKVQTQI